MISKTKLSFRFCRHNIFLRDKNIKELFSSTFLGFHWNFCIINQYLRLIGTPAILLRKQLTALGQNI